MALKFLPKNYLRIASVDFAENGKTIRRIDAGALLSAAVMVGAGLVFVPFSTFMFFSAVTRGAVFRAAGLIPALLLYTLLHTAIRYLLLKKIGGVKPRVGVSRLAPRVSSGAYLSNREFARTALLPTLIFFIIYMVLDAVLPIRWFWFVYILQIINISGAAGDFYTVLYSRRFGDDVLILDGGSFTEFYIKAELAEK